MPYGKGCERQHERLLRISTGIGRLGKNLGPLLNLHGDLVTKNIVQAEIFSAFFALVFTGKSYLQESQVPVIGRIIWSREDLPSLKEDLILEHFNGLDTCKSTGPYGMHPQVLKKLAIARLLSMVFERLWRLAEVPDDGKKEKFISIFRKDKEEDPGNERLVSLTLISGKVVKDTKLATTSKKNE